jgi:phosphonopyruvate decarboxylase
MISPERFFQILSSNGINFYTGVPDSLLKDFCAYVTDNVSKKDHIINSNEGAAIALACGHYIATGKPGLVYLQNSGLGNAINPLLSLADSEVYGIPLLMIIGWRGEPGKKDEPQHIKQGKVMLDLLEAMNIPYELINSSTENTEEIIGKAYSKMTELSCPFALVISEGTFEGYKLVNDTQSDYQFNREEAINIILNELSNDEIIVSTTGKASREVFEYRKKNKQGHQNDFLTVGSMGHCSQIALGIALEKSKRQVYVLDGDGAVIMQMGSLAILGSEAPENFRHILINNGSHDSVGGQPTAGFITDFSAIAGACGYNISVTAETEKQIKEGLALLKKNPGPAFLEIRVNKGSRKDLGRPTSSPAENKISLMENLSK